MRILLSEQQLQASVERLAGQLNEHYVGQPVVLIGVLTGSLILLADLVRRLNMPLRIALVQARSYHGQATVPGELSLGLGDLPDLSGQHVLLIDDIFDTGNTLDTLVEQLKLRRPRTLRSAVLLVKLGRQQVTYVPDYFGFEIPDEFVVGYGMDYDDRYRNLPYVAVLDEQDIAADQASAVRTRDARSGA